MRGLELGPLETSHIPEILEIEKTLFPTPWTPGMFEQEVADRPSEEGPGSYAVVATKDGRVAGYAIAWFIESGVHLLNIAVRGELQRQGVGTVLLDDLIETASKAGKRILVLEVRASNVTAQAFYQRFRFESVGVRPGYYSDDCEDAILMAIDLAPFARRERRGTGKRKTT